MLLQMFYPQIYLKLIEVPVPFPFVFVVEDANPIDCIKIPGITNGSVAPDADFVK